MSWASCWLPPASSTITPLTPRSFCTCRYESRRLPGAGLETDNLSELHVFLDDDVEVLDSGLALLDRVLAVAGDKCGQLVDEVDEIGALGAEVRL